MRTAHLNTRVCLSAPADAGVDSQVSEKHEEEYNNNEAFQTYVASGKSPGEMSRHTTRTFKFKIEVQIPSMCRSTATCDQILHAANVLGVYNKYSPLIKFDPKFVTRIMLGKHSLTAVACWSLPRDDLVSFVF